MNNEDLQAEITRIEGWIKNADTKIGVLLAFLGVLIVILANRFIDVVFNLSSPILLVTAYFIALVLLVMSTLKTLFGIIPRLSHNQKNKSLLYYLDISDMPIESFRRATRSITPSQYKKMLSNQMHALSRIAARKMSNFKDSSIYLAVALLVIGVAEITYRYSELTKFTTQ